MLYGEPIHVPPKIRREELAEYTREVQQAVDDLNDRAVELSGVPMPPLTVPSEDVSDAQQPDDQMTRAA
jgi:hypothetical protein